MSQAITRNQGVTRRGLHWCNPRRVLLVRLAILQGAVLVLIPISSCQPLACDSFVEAVEDRRDRIRFKHQVGCVEASDCVLVETQFDCDDVVDGCPRAISAAKEEEYEADVRAAEDELCPHLFGPCAPPEINSCGPTFALCLDGRCVTSSEPEAETAGD